ncbi:MAG: DnaD domain protein [Dehalococcoidales bacterium]|nr:DnaD domain protein [Dehalococcoidales bacterium]
MTQFQGFPSGGKVKYTAVPDVFFSAVLPQITDINELKVTLHLMAALYNRKGYPRFLHYSELVSDTVLMQSLQVSEGILQDALKKAVGRGTILSLTIEKEKATENIYLLNDESSRQALLRIQTGTLKLAGIEAVKNVPINIEEQPNIYKLYEDNFGVLTPLIAEQLRDAEENYPEGWIRDAMKQAINQGKRNWNIVSAILQRWSVEGRSDGTYRRHIKKTDPGKFIKGKYGRMVQR